MGDELPWYINISYEDLKTAGSVDICHSLSNTNNRLLPLIVYSGVLTIRTLLMDILRSR
jgi:hypothetical protein